MNLLKKKEDSAAGLYSNDGADGPLESGRFGSQSSLPLQSVRLTSSAGHSSRKSTA